LLDSVPVGVFTVIVPVVAPAGTVVWIAELEAVNVAAVPLNPTAVVPARFVPRIMTFAPTLPEVGRVCTNGPRPVARLKTVPHPVSQESLAPYSVVP
jgi:hypothetical protein